MTDTKQEPKSAFLIAQEKLMQARAEQDRSIEDRQRYTLTPGANEKCDPSAKYELVRHDITNNTVERRVITPSPQPERIRPAQPLTKDELSDMIVELRNEMATEQEKVDRKDELDAAAANKRGQLIAKVNELTAQLNAAKSELDQLNREGSVRDGWIEFGKRAELRITQIATGVYGFLLEKFSQDRHEAPFGELTALLKEDVRFKADRSGVRGLTQASFARLHAAPREQISNARIEATLEKVYTATETLERILDK